MLYEFLSDVVVQTVLITFFVLSMIMVLEYVNVFTEGYVHGFMQRHSKLQILIASLLGVTPGCLGTYTAVSLYIHDVIGIGALVANFVATVGDEAFYMITFMPTQAIWVFLSMFAISLVAGYVVAIFARKRRSSLGQESHFILHKHHDSTHVRLKSSIIENIRNITAHRVVLILAITTFIVLTFCGVLEEHHDHSDAEVSDGFAVKVTFIVLSFISLFVILRVPDHFLEEHIWHHVIGKHFLKVLQWTAIALTAIFILNNLWDFEAWIEQYSNGSVYWICVLIAILVGFAPQSGPHAIIISLYISGVMPLGGLLANCIIQDGHGSIPLFAESTKDYIIVKAIKLALAILIASVFYIVGI